MQGAHTDGVRAAQWVGPPPTWLTSGLGVGPLKTQLKSTAHHCQLPPHPKPRTPRQQMPHCSPSWPSRRDSGSFPRPAGLLTNPASHSRWRGPGQRWWQGLGTAGRGRGPFVAEPPNRMRRCPLPAPSLPSSACASRLHPGPPPPSHRRLLVHLGLGLGWGGEGRAPVTSTPQACPWSPLQPAPPTVLSCCRQSWGLWSLWQRSAEKRVGVSPAQRVCGQPRHRLATASLSLGITRPEGGCQGERTRPLRSTGVGEGGLAPG